jgi:regulator of cell morphogenesis and NO signaling
MENFAQIKVAEIVAKNYLTAMIFTKYGIDFCCNGKRSIEKACLDSNANILALQQDIEAFFKETQQTELPQYNQWPLEALVHHVKNKHHSYIKDHVPLINGYLTKLCRVHGENHPELFTITELFAASSSDLLLHLQKEENILFPYILELDLANKNRTPLAPTPFGTVRNPITMMMHEHTIEGERFRKIRELSNDYTPPAKACNTYKAAYAALEDYERDLHLHIHLENNLIFETAIDYEDKASRA